MNDQRESEPKIAATDRQQPSWLRRSFNPFRIATLRGLGVVLPPLLTMMLFVWAWNTIDRTVLRPVESISQTCIAWAIGDIREDADVRQSIQQADQQPNISTTSGGRTVVTTDDGSTLVLIGNQWIPRDIFSIVDQNPGESTLTSAHAYYKRYAEIRYLKRHLTIPAFLAIFLALMYLVGKLLAAGIGRMFWRSIESLINQLPIIRNVYSSVKQVTDFAFNETDAQFNRVVAVEYPRKGIWSMGFVTGESLNEIRNATGEPMLSVLMPTSPMPATGFTVTVAKSETIDLNITIDQAIQFCVSCGVVVPDQQSAKTALEGQVRHRTEKIASDSNSPTPDSN